MPLWFAKLIEYWKPEQPPPTTPIRRPAGIGSWVAMISRTLVIAFGVNVTGVDAAAGAVTTSGTGFALAVAIGISSTLVPVYACATAGASTRDALSNRCCRG